MSDFADFYRIDFKPLKNALYYGAFYLDKNSLAYVSAEFALTSHGIDMKNRLHLGRGKYVSAKFTVSYKRINDVWQLSLAVADGIIKKRKANSLLRYTAEYFATSHEPVEKTPFKNSDILTYGEVYSKRNKSFYFEFLD